MGKRSPSECVTEVSRRWSGVKLSFLESLIGGDISAGWAGTKFGPILGNFGSNSFSVKLFRRRDWKGSKCSAGAVVAGLAASWDFIHSAVASCCWAKLTAAGDASWLLMAARCANLGKKSIGCCCWCCCWCWWWCGCCWCMIGKNARLESWRCCCRCSCCCCCCCCWWSRWDKPTSLVSNISDSSRSPSSFYSNHFRCKARNWRRAVWRNYVRGWFRQSAIPLEKVLSMFPPQVVAVVVVVAVDNK